MPLLRVRASDSGFEAVASRNTICVFDHQATPTSANSTAIAGAPASATTTNIARPPHALEYASLRVSESLDDQFTRACFSSNGEILIVGTSTGILIVFHVETGTVLQVVADAHIGHVNALAISSKLGSSSKSGGGDLLVTASDDTEVKLWHVDASDPLGVDALIVPVEGSSNLINLHSGAVYAVGFDPTGAWFCSGGEDGELFLFNTQRLLERSSHDSASNNSSMRKTTPPPATTTQQKSRFKSPEMQSVLLASPKSEVAKNNSNNSEPAHQQLNVCTGSSATALCFAPGYAKPVLVVGDWNGQLIVADSSKSHSSAAILKINAHWRGVSAVAVSPSGETIVSGSFDAKVKLWRMVDGTPIAELGEHSSFIKSISFLPPLSSSSSSSSSTSPIILFSVCRDGQCIFSDVTGSCSKQKQHQQPLIVCGALHVEGTGSSSDGKSARGSADNTSSTNNSTSTIGSAMRRRNTHGHNNHGGTADLLDDGDDDDGSMDMSRFESFREAPSLAHACFATGGGSSKDRTLCVLPSDSRAGVRLYSLVSGAARKVAHTVARGAPIKSLRFCLKSATSATSRPDTVEARDIFDGEPILVSLIRNEPSPQQQAAVQQQQQLHHHVASKLETLIDAESAKRDAQLVEEFIHESNKDHNLGGGGVDHPHPSSAAALSAVPDDADPIETFLSKIPRNLVFEQSDIELIPGGRLGAGGGGSVVKARIRGEFGVDCAAKVFREKQQIGSVLRELELSLKLRNHPNVLTTLGVLKVATMFSTDLVLLMELADGGSLDRFLARTPEPPVPLVIHFVRQVASALAYLHQRRIIHRDLKCANILVFSQQNPPLLKLADLGIARQMSAVGAGGGAGGTNSGTEVTHAGAGTLRWMAPELLNARGSDAADDIARKVGPRVDVYAFGCVVFQLISAGGAEPWENSTLREICGGGLANQLKARAEILQQAPWLVELCERALSINPVERPHDGVELLRLIEENIAAAEIAAQQQQQQQQLHSSSSMMTMMATATSSVMMMAGNNNNNGSATAPMGSSGGDDNNVVQSQDVTEQIMAGVTLTGIHSGSSSRSKN